MTTAELRAETSDSERGPRQAATAFWLVAVAYGVVMMGGTLPIPLYRFWAAEMHFGSFGTTAIFAVYAFGVLVSLLVFASASDQLGRRPVFLAALVVLLVSTWLFLTAGTLAGLIVARFVFGLAAGVVTATANAALAELAGPDRTRFAAVTATVANMGGFGLGSVASGAVARFVNDPTHVVFWSYSIALGIALVAIVLVPETVSRQPGFRLAVRRPTLPRGAERGAFLRTLGLVSAAFAVNGLFSSLAPAFVRDQLAVSDIFIASAVVSIIFVAALLAQVLPQPRWLSGRVAGPWGLVFGVGIFEVGLLAKSLTAFLVGTAVAGAGVGLVFGRGLGMTQRLADAGRRADLIAMYFLAAYLGLTIPTLALGVFDQVFGTAVATLVLGAVIAATTTLATIPIRRFAAHHRHRPLTPNEGPRP